MKDNSTIAERKISTAATINAMKKITEMPKDGNWRYNAKHCRNCVATILDICQKSGIIPTVNMMSMALGVSKMTEYNVRTEAVAAAAEVVEVLNGYVRICENVMLQGTLDGTINNIGGIFGMKALYGYRDEPKEIVVTHNFNGLLGERRDPEAIAARYAEAVVVDVEPSEMRYLKQEKKDGEESETDES